MSSGIRAEGGRGCQRAERLEPLGVLAAAWAGRVQGSWTEED